MKNSEDSVTRNFLVQDNEMVVDLNNPVARNPANPLLSARMVNAIWKSPGLQVKTVHNAGIAELNGDIIMLFRSHLRNGISVLGMARSSNGISGWHVDRQPALIPCGPEDVVAKGVDREEIIENEAGGVEDPRISKIDDTYLITYSAYHSLIKDRVRVSLATTKDFKTFMRYGSILNRDMRNVIIFPEKISGKYVGLFRPNDIGKGALGGIFKQIQIGYSDDWRSNDWKIDDQPVMRQEGGPSAMSDKIGPGAPVIKTKYGWLNIYHGVRSTMDGNPYVLGVAIHDLSDPRNLRISSIPILFPSRADCRVDDTDYVHVPNVVFTCGAWRRDDGVVYLYYGGNDTVMNLAFSHEDVLAELCHRYPREGLTGRPAYELT